MQGEVDKAVAHAYTLFREHVERYRTEILVEPSAWCKRCDELHQNLQWLIFCRDYPLTPRRKLPPRDYPPTPPPAFRR